MTIKLQDMMKKLFAPKERTAIRRHAGVIAKRHMACVICGQADAAKPSRRTKALGANGRARKIAKKANKPLP